MDFEERLKKAIESIKNGKSQNEASKLYDIPKVKIYIKLILLKRNENNKISSIIFIDYHLEKNEKNKCICLQ